MFRHFIAETYKPNNDTKDGMQLGKRIVLLALLVAGLAASCFVAGQRVRIESRNKAVDIVLDYNEIDQIASASGKTIGDVLGQFKKAGTTGVAVTELTFRDAIDNGWLIPTTDRKYSVSPAVGKRIEAHLKSLYPNHPPVKLVAQAPIEGQPPANTATLVVLPGVSLTYLKQLPIGLPEDALKAVNSARLEVVGRLISYQGATPQGINATMDDAKSNGIKTIIFSGDTVLGFKGAVDDTAQALKRNGLYFGKVEFAKQKGEQKLAEKIEDSVIIVHSINSNEMPTLDQPSIVERFERAARERDVRIAYIRMYETSSADLVGDNTQYLAKIVDGIRQEGYTPTNAHPYQEISVPKFVRVLAGVGVAAGAMLLLLAVADVSIVATILWSLLIIAMCAGLSIFGDTGRKAAALLSAMIFPTLAVLTVAHNTPDSPGFAPRLILRTLGRFLFAVAITVAGGMLIVGLLSGRAFMLRIDQFMGVKLAHLAPILILAILFTGAIAWSSEAWGLQKRRFVRKLKEIGSDPILMWQAAGVAVALVVVAMMVARSGNEPGVGVSPMELKFRAILDKVLYVRPRTKEFLLGYPALIVGIGFALRGLRRWAAPLLVIGAIGLVSALNTFCHIHTPLALSAMRVVNGVVVGGLFGLIGYLVVRNLPGKPEDRK